ncbi:hypothetical protein L3X38_032047 [Prunus dulcis]|uniref:Uncharacterized protein n=1 Tax=Prunus dulcis TaxID=3755 RepID=A0AAD4YVJ4_PRUDU|nr:hypothetical protein L3X38_032047 [Prunus dulcis]
MASSSSSMLLFLSLLLLVPYITSSNIIIIPISHLPQNPHPNPYQHLSYLANSSLKRAHHLKNPQTTPPHTNAKIPLFSLLLIPLSFGTPLPKPSPSSWTLIANSDRKTVPGDTLGTHTPTALATQVEVYHLKCNTSGTAAGITGLGRGPASLPTQLAVKKFSYCLLSHLFDETNKSSSVVLSVERTPVKKTKGVSYTPFVKNPEVPGRGHFLTSYYVGLRRITVGGRSVKISYRYLRPDKNSSGGTIVDSRTTFTYMAPEVFECMAGEFEKFTKGYKREEEVEALTRLRPCYNVSRIETPTFPSVTFHFNGGLRWRCRRRITWCQPVGRWCA